MHNILNGLNATGIVHLKMVKMFCVFYLNLKEQKNQRQARHVPPPSGFSCSIQSSWSSPDASYSQTAHPACGRIPSALLSTPTLDPASHSPPVSPAFHIWIILKASRPPQPMLPEWPEGPCPGLRQLLPLPAPDPPGVLTPVMTVVRGHHSRDDASCSIPPSCNCLLESILNPQARFRPPR